MNKKPTQKQKEFEKEKELAALIYDIGKQRENLDRLVEVYRNSAYEAAKMGHDEYANELLTNVGDLRHFIQDLQFIELEIKTAAITAKTFKALQGLPSALKSVSDVFSKGIKVGKIGDSLRNVRATLQGARAQFSEIRNAISSDSERTSRDLFGDIAGVAANPKANKFFEEEKKALEARLALETASPAPMTAAAATAAATSEASARVDDIIGMLDQEKRK